MLCFWGNACEYEFASFWYLSEFWVWFLCVCVSCTVHTNYISECVFLGWWWCRRQAWFLHLLMSQYQINSFEGGFDANICATIGGSYWLQRVTQQLIWPVIHLVFKQSNFGLAHLTLNTLLIEVDVFIDAGNVRILANLTATYCQQSRGLCHWQQ